MMTLLNGIESDQISTKDRGLNYGDGVFETIAVHNKKLHYWSEHYNRLKGGCERLGIKTPVQDDLLSDIAKLDLNDDSSVVKIVVTRGEGGRGYSTEGIDKTNIIISNNPWPKYVKEYQNQGIKLRLCQHRLIINPALAGIKHLNRLDQVLARNEWHNNEAQEGLMLDQSENIIEGISTNIFMKINNQWVTPLTESCAVAGVMRAAVLTKSEIIGMKIEQRTIKHAELLATSQMFVCNSIWGVVPVRSCDYNQFEIGDDFRQLQTELEQEIESVSYVI